MAIPFSGIEELSFQAANEVACQLIAEGDIVFSPISHSYPIWKTGRVEHTHDVWLKQDKAFVEWADEIVVVVPDYREDLVMESKGVQMELGWAKEMNKPISYLMYESKTNSIMKEGSVF